MFCDQLVETSCRSGWAESSATCRCQCSSAVKSGVHSPPSSSSECVLHIQTSSFEMYKRQLACISTFVVIIPSALQFPCITCTSHFPTPPSFYIYLHILLCSPSDHKCSSQSFGLPCLTPVPDFLFLTSFLLLSPFLLLPPPPLREAPLQLHPFPRINP